MKLALSLIFLLILLPKSSHPSAFLIYNQDARSNAMGLAVVASVDNPSSVFFNPARLPTLGRSGFSFNATGIISDMRYKDAISGEEFHTKDTFHHLYSLYAYYTSQNFSIGFGVFSPFGLSTKWEKDFPGRYYSIYSSLKTIFFNPVLAWRASERNSFAFGFSYIRGSVRFDSSLPIQPPYEGIIKLKGEGESFGINFAAYRDLGGGYTLGLSFRSPTRIRFQGKGRFLSPIPPGEIVAEASTEFTFPHILAVGVAKKFSRTIFELDLLHTGWAKTGNYSISSDGGIFDRSVKKRWKNTLAFLTGLNYRLKDDMELRLGYMYDVSPVPDSTRGPELPDSSRNIIFLGGTYHFLDKRINFSYQATLFKKAKSSLLGLAGHYKNFAHLILVSLDYEK